MNITNYIVEFLKQGNTVEIKGIGTFSPKTISTRFDEETKTYFPTVNTVEFSTVCKGNEQIISYIAKQEFIGITTAEKLWDNYIAALNEKLRIDGKHEFPEVGELVMSAENGYSFNIFDGVNFSKATRNLPILNDVMTYELESNRENPFDKFDSPIIPSEQEEVLEPEPIADEQVQQQEEAVIEENNVEAEQQTENVASQVEAVEELETESNQSLENNESEVKVEEEGKTDNNIAEEVKVEEAKEERIEEAKEEVHENQAAVEEPKAEVEGKGKAKESKKKDKKDKKKEKKEKKGKKKKIIIPIIILLLLLLLGGAYYYFVMIKDMNIPFINEKVETTEVDEVEANSETQSDEVGEESNEVIDADVTESEVVGNEVSEETVADTDNDNDGETEEVTESGKKVKRIDLFKGENMYTFDYMLIPIEDKDEVITSTCKVLVASMQPQIKSFLKKQRYSTAVAPMEERMNEYVIKRLKELFDDDFFHPARMMSYDNYITDYCTDNLQRQRISRAKNTIISEIKMNDILLEFLNELIEAGAVTKDKVVAPAPKPKVVPTADIRLRSKQGFDIISGFFKSRDNAVKEAHRFSRRGADAYVISKGNLYYVSLGSAPSLTAAEALLRQLKTWNKENMVIKQW